MASKTTIMLIDDVDGSEAEETVTFAIDGVNFEIDLSTANAVALRESLRVWTGAARRTGGRAKVMRRITLPDARPGYSGSQRSSMQRFARERGLKVPGDRGRIAQEVSSAWEEAGRPT